MTCPICSNTSFDQLNILLPRLIEEWELNPKEVSYINKQQGYHCMNCNSSLRSMTLADSILNYYSLRIDFQLIGKSKFARTIKLLEINEAGNLHSIFNKFKKFHFAEYPKVDMQNMPYTENYFDMVVHSDTLEHVENSGLALKECYRVLKNGGVLFYTIPIVYERLTRRRDNLKNSFHGSQDEGQGDDFKVWTEYGADFWVEIINAGFKDITMHTISDLASISIIAIKTESENNRRNTLSSFKNKVKSILKSFL